MMFVDLNVNVHIENKTKHQNVCTNQIRQPSIIITDTMINISIITDFKIIFIL